MHAVPDTYIMKAPRCISLGAGAMHTDSMQSGWVWSRVWCGVCKENRPTAIQGWVSYPQELEGWSKVFTLFLYLGPLVQTTSDNTSKAVPSSKSDWTLSHRRADSASAAKK